MKRASSHALFRRDFISSVFLLEDGITGFAVVCPVSGFIYSFFFFWIQLLFHGFQNWLWGAFEAHLFVSVQIFSVQRQICIFCLSKPKL